jgi:RHS repeat-associated protein
VVEERVDAETDPERQFVWGLRYIDDLILRDRDTNGDGSLNERLFALQDANWNLTGLIDTAGDVQERYAYSAYGQPLFLTPSFGGRVSSSFDWETLYAGYRWETLTELFHVRHRVLNSALGTWLQRDPLGLSAGTTLYRYTGSRPIDETDSQGTIVDMIVDAVCDVIQSNVFSCLCLVINIVDAGTSFLPSGHPLLIALNVADCVCDAASALSQCCACAGQRGPGNGMGSCAAAMGIAPSSVFGCVLDFKDFGLSNLSKALAQLKLLLTSELVAAFAGNGGGCRACKALGLLPQGLPC